MPKTIAIIAPFIDTRQFNMDFTLRLVANNRDLSLATFFEWASEGFNASMISRGMDYGEDIPSAGFYLQGVLHQHGYQTVLTNKYDPETLRKLGEKELFAICVSTTMVISTESLLDLFSVIRKAIPGVPIIAGGVNIWKSYFQYEKSQAFPADYPLHPGMLFHPSNAGMDADVLVVAQHGIYSLLMVLDAWGHGGMEAGKRGSGETLKQGSREAGRRGNVLKIPNLCLPGKKGFVFTKIVEEKVDYNSDYTRWDLIEEMPEKIPVRTSIGCPYRCRFCDFCHLFPKIFLRSRESLLQELKLVKERLGQNPGLIHVTDDNVFATKKRLFEVCGAIEESGLTHWMGFMRGGEYSREEMEAIKRSGLMMGKMGVESGDQGQLDRMNKKQKADKMKIGIEQFDAEGIATLLTFIVGFPGETGETLQNTIDFLNGLKMTNLSASYQVYPLLVFPLSEIAEPAARAKWSITGYADHWSHYTMNSDEAKKACYDFFKAVTNVPYDYAEESHFFNRGMFDFETRKRLFRLRQQLTINLLENSHWQQVEPILQEMALLMEVPASGIQQHLTKEIFVPDFSII